MAQIIINGKNYSGNSVVIKDNGNTIIIDGDNISFDNNTREIKIEVNGNINTLESRCGDIEITGNVDKLTSGSGDISITGNVEGHITSGSGDINCNNIGGDCKTGSGNILYKRS